MNIRVALLTAAAAAALVSASASAQQGPYVGAGVGATWIGDADVIAPTGRTKAEFETGYAALLKGGYDFGGGWRGEGEFGWRNWGTDGAAGGDLRAYTLFANALYDFMPGNTWSPYLGAGVGLVRYSADNIRSGGVTTNDQDNTWGAQAIAGAWYALDSNWQVSADYRFMYTGDATLYSDAGGARMEPDNKIHTVMLGLTYKFGVPAKPAPAPTPVAAPAPAPAPAPAAAAPAPRAPETYIVFFAFDKSDISPVAAQVLDRAIADFRATGSTNVRIEGNADRSGSNAYNQRLSQRRADAVATYLAGKGIARNAIQTVANGEEKPRVPTADGVRNDENRNAQVYLRK